MENTSDRLSALAKRDWAEVSIPGSAPPVSLARLDSGAYLVRFPAGWSRPSLGHYDVTEEALFIGGSLTMGGRRYLAGDYGWFPSGYTRERSSSPQGALAFAWFSGPSSWFEGRAGESDRAHADTVRATWHELEPRPIPGLAIHGRPLREGADRSSYLVDAIPDGLCLPTDAVGADVFDLALHAAGSVEVGGRLPPVATGPALLRLVWG